MKCDCNVKSKIVPVIITSLMIGLAVLGIGCSMPGADNVPQEIDAAHTSENIKAARPDLYIPMISHTYAELVIGQYDTYKVYVYNIGSATSPSTTLRFQTGGSVTYHTIPSLAAGSSWWVSRNIMFGTAGTYLITAKADAYNTVSESDETNNVKQIVVPVKDYGNPDLYINSLSYSGTPQVGHFMYFSVQVMNHLQCGMSPATKLQIRFNGEFPGQTYNIPALAPGQGYSVGRGYTPGSPGTLWVRAVADAENDAVEKDESNNLRVRTISISN